MARQSEAVAGLGMVGVAADRWASAGAEAVVAQAEASDRAGVFAALGRFSRLALQIIVLGLAASLVVGGEITPGAMIAASIMIARALAPVEQAIGVWRQLAGAGAAFGRVRTALERAAEQGPWMPLPHPEETPRGRRRHLHAAGVEALVAAIADARAAGAAVVMVAHRPSILAMPMRCCASKTGRHSWSPATGRQP